MNHNDSAAENKSSDRKPNRLINEKSPYLLQHAYNPVDWFPWGEEAFFKAKQEDRPIFLSIGYSTCHWCHVMETESFEDAQVADLMNDTFVAIKVDREERPDIDHIYMTVCQMMTGGGGWPLNIIMTPDKKPFFAGTYFPKESHHGRIGMIDLAPRIKQLWSDNRDEVVEASRKVTSALNQIPDDAPGAGLNMNDLREAYTQLAQRFDTARGGFSQAPKFPTPHNLLFLMRYAKRTSEKSVLAMVEKTLENMRRGGIYDHIGFGFHRYSTDNEWLVPHFEKMLYDQAMIALAYTEAYQITGNSQYRKTVEEIFEYVLRDMTSKDGAFFSAEDADSEGIEGKFYVWSLDEMLQILSAGEARVACKIFGIRAEGNFKEESTGHLTGDNIIHLDRSLAQNASELGMSLEQLEEIFEKIRIKLFTEREKRTHPYKDDKILTDWNGLMIASLAKASQAFGDLKYAKAAMRSADFIIKKMRDEKGRPLHRYRDGDAGLPAHVDDYAFLIWGLIELYEATFVLDYLKIALELNDDFLDRFWEKSVGGFYFTAHDTEETLVRKKELYDGATPSGNSVAALNLIRLARLTSNLDLEEKANRILEVFTGIVSKFPSGYTHLLMAVDYALGPSYEIVLVAREDSEDYLEFKQKLQQPFVPNKVIIFKPVGGQAEKELVNLAQFTREHTCLDGKPTAYICKNFRCELPSTDLIKTLEMMLSN
ncbi:MAG: thioredoxin domain-containing protein [Desulfomonilaceae bacterium]